MKRVFGRWRLRGSWGLALVCGVAAAVAADGAGAAGRGAKGRGGKAADERVVAPPVRAGLDPVRLGAIDRAIEEAIQEKRCPGGVFWLEHRGVAYSKAYGSRSLEPEREVMTLDTVFDAASLTKVLATAPAVMKLIERGKVRLDEPATRYVPWFDGGGKDAITVRHLLTHTSGLRPGLPRVNSWEGVEAAKSLAAAETVQKAPGTQFVYSDINYIVLGELVRAVSGQRLDAFCEANFYRPLRMVDTAFRPTEGKGRVAGEGVARIAPTERQGRGEVLRGVVHDPSARRMGGVAGHAGLFTTASDVARFARMMLGEGELEGVRVLKAETVRLMSGVQSPAGVNARRGLGWDIDTGYSGPRGGLFPIGSYGHTGWTGTSLWVDPFSETLVVFLSNRNHPTEDGNILALRRRLGTLAAESVLGFDWQNVPGALAPLSTNAVSTNRPAGKGGQAGVMNGVDVMARDGFRALSGKRVGLITNHTGRDRGGRSTADLLKAAEGVKLAALFSPEHGIRGVQDELVADGRDERTGLPVYSLYGAVRAPKPEHMSGLDVVVFDIQDMGCRFYTYISTLGHCMEAAGKAGIPFYVLDRVNPLGGVGVEGPVLTGARSFVAWHEIPLRHGMTVGELARMYNAERKLGVDLVVVGCEGWRRPMWMDETGLGWVNPSPNMRSLTAGTLYPGVGMIEFCNISVGRGTERPFEWVGAPYVDAAKLVKALRGERLPGIEFEEARFTPDASKFKGQECHGARFRVTDRLQFRPVDLGVALARHLRALHGAEFDLGKAERLVGDGRTMRILDGGGGRMECRAQWHEGLVEFLGRRQKYLLY